MNSDLVLFRRILANDLRVYFRSGKASSRIGGGLLQLLGLLFLHFPAMYMVRGAEGGAWAGLGATMVLCLLTAAAFQRTLETLYNRGDLPFLLASPVPLRVIVATRLVDVTLTSLAGSALIIVPLLDCAVFFHGRQWLWGWAAWIACSAIVVPFALGITLRAVRRFGARRTRVGVQLFSLAIGMSGFAIFQASNWGHRAADGPMLRAQEWMQWFAHAPFNLLADAARGDPATLGALFAMALLASIWALRRLARDFALGALETTGDTGSDQTRSGRATDPWAGHFLRPRWQVIVLKELRLVVRDPLLMARSSIQIITILPGMAGAFLYRAHVGLAGVAMVGPAMAAALLAALMIANDDAPEHPAASPISRRRIAIARTAAAAFPPSVLGAVAAVAILALGHPGIALAAAAGAILNATSLAWAAVCSVRPHTAEERARNKQPMVLGHTLFAVLVGGLGAGAVGAHTAGQPIAALAIAIVAAGAASLSFLRRPSPRWSTN